MHPVIDLDKYGDSNDSPDDSNGSVEISTVVSFAYFSN